MQMSSACMACILDKQALRIRDYPDETKKAQYLQAVMALIAQSDRDVSAPLATRRIEELHGRFFGFTEDLTETKHRHNQMMLRIREKMLEQSHAASEPVSRALCYARAGNYIDLGAMNEVKDDLLMEIIERAATEQPDEKTLARFLKELETAREMVIITDNAGEIVCDGVLMQILKEKYPQLHITALVRGAMTSNDATREDAIEAGIDRYADIADNGTPIAGTEMRLISGEARSLLENADLILSKGQGNFETLLGCRLNVYYIFLCKCDWFVRRFALPRFTGVFVREEDVSISKYLVGENEEKEHGNA